MSDSPAERACPNCAEAIKADAILCRFCGHGISNAHFRKCPACAEMIRRDAVMCRWCRTSVGVEYVKPAQVKSTLEMQFGVNFLSLETTAVWPDCLKLLSEKDIRKYQAVPVRRSAGRLLVAMVNPNDAAAIDALKQELGSEIKPTVCTQQSFDWFMENKYSAVLREDQSHESAAPAQSARREHAAKRLGYDALEHGDENDAGFGDEEPGFGEFEDSGNDDDDTDVVDTLPDLTPPPRLRPKQGMPLSNDAPIVLLANMILADGIKCGAIEVRIEQNRDATKVFNVIRGEPKLARTLPTAVGKSLAARFKQMAGMDAAARPQRGAAEVTIADKPYRVAIETKDSPFGETVLLQPRQRAS